MSPRRHGSPRSPSPSASRRRTTDQPSRSARGTTAATSAASRSRSVVGGGGPFVGLGAEQHHRGARPRRRSRTGSSATYSGCDSGSATMSSRKIALTHVDHRPRGAEVAGEVARRRRRTPSAPAGTRRCRRAGSGRSTASGRRPRRGGRGRPASSSHRWARGVGLARREQHGEVALDRVGVLELVEQQAGVAGAQPLAHLPAVLGVAQHRAGQHEQVVELELAGGPAAPSASRSVNCASSHASRRTTASATWPRQLGRPWLAERTDLGAHVVGGAVVGPVGLLAVPHVDRSGAPSVEQPQLLVLVGRGEQPRRATSARSTSLSSSLSSASRQCTPRAAHLRRARRAPARARRERRRVGLLVHALGHEVPVGVARERERAQHRERGVGVEREEDGAFERGIVEQVVDEAGPALLERELRRDVVEHLRRAAAGRPRPGARRGCAARTRAGWTPRPRRAPPARAWRAPRRPGRRRARPAPARAGCGRAARPRPSR